MNLHLVSATLEIPAWLHITHYINLLFIGLLIRSGIQILGAHPRLYFNDGCKPGTEWLNFTHKKIPAGKLWTSMDEEVPTLLGLSVLWNGLERGKRGANRQADKLTSKRYWQG